MEKHWESYDKPNYKRMMAELMDCDFCGGTDEVGYVDDDLTLKVCEHCDVDGSNPQIHSAETFEAETLHEKGDYRIIAENDDMWDENWTDSAKEMAEEYGVYTLRVQKKIMGGWETIDSLSGVIASDDGKNSLKDFALTEMEIPEGVNFDAEEPVIEEPDWIPDGDGRAIGQQDFAINLSPLHAESRFDKLSKEIAEEYEEKGKSPEEAERIGDATAAKIGRAKYGKKGMMKMQKKGMSAETLAEIEGPTAEATAGGLHSPSSFTIGWEDDAGYSSASLPPNEIAWAEDVKGSESFITGSILAVGLGIVGVIAAIKFGSKKKSDTASGDDTKKAEKGCGCAKNVKKSSSVKESEYSVNQINPVEVEGQNDIHNAESVKLPSPYSGPQTAHRQNNRPTRNLW